MRVLQTDQSRSGIVKVLSPYRFEYSIDRGHSVIAVERSHLNAGYDGRSAGFMNDYVVRGRYYDLVSPEGMSQYRELISESSRGNENGRFLSEDFGGDLFQTVDGGVVAVNVVADFGVRHGRAHLFSRKRHGITSQVYPFQGRSSDIWLGLQIIIDQNKQKKPDRMIRTI